MVAWQGALPAVLAGLMPGLAQGTPMMAALLLFLGGISGGLVVAFGAIVLWQSRKARGAAREA